MNPLKVIIILLVITAVALIVAPAEASQSDSTGQYCEAKSETCVERGVTGPNELTTPAQIDWENDPAFKHGGLPPKNAK
ncbi:hypothetical protein SBP1_gp019 [Vibrio virus vB_VspP_SBP1]|uniref:Uncharacterized protein n=1 Tax=Vibrio virus vB_VspP_SBP1 TaxID=2500581 RepID=A0A3T0IIH8_9CAUD|nr:hypothetical protein KNU36_gp110 [Vibrio virus vB_VspP_SBP1]AZU99611.1 hypothetical protein SBP1_gp019 [Vibrio virus vB_VspP_SBP1]